VSRKSLNTNVQLAGASQNFIETDEINLLPSTSFVLHKIPKATVPAIVWLSPDFLAPSQADVFLDRFGYFEPLKDDPPSVTGTENFFVP
jgi:hypothetical protein